MSKMLNFSRLFFVVVVSVNLCTGHQYQYRNNDYRRSTNSSQSQGQQQQQQQQEGIGPPVFNIGGGSTLPPQTSTADSGWPWRHHVDFNQQHPGEDQLAVESSRSSSSAYPHYQRQSAVFSRRSQAPRSTAYHNPFNALSGFSQHGGGGGDGGYNLLNIYSPRSWWKGPNVCIKREEEDERQGQANSGGYGSERGGENSTSGYPALHMTLSSCENLGTQHLCTTRILGQGVRKLLKTVYECCDGYTINQRSQECERGRFENIAKTMKALGAHEFIKLLRANNLIGKVETEELTIFVPTDEAVKAYRSPSSGSRPQERSQLSNSPSSEVIRRRRNVLLHDHLNPRQNQDSRSNDPRNQHNNANPVRQSSRTRGDQDVQHQQQPSAIIEMNFDDVEWRRNVLDDQDNYTSQPDFVPADEPLTGNREMEESLLSHMLQGKISTAEFVDEKVIFNQMNQGQSHDRGVIRMNTWDIDGERVNTVNCARMVSVNHRCTNGNIHLINRMMEPVTRSIADIIANDPNFSIVYSLLHTGRLLEKFRDTTQHLTLLAPTNQAMTENLEPGLLDKMRRGDPCLQRILQNHIIPISFCSTVILKKGQVRNLNHGILDVERNGDDQVFINGSKILKRDIIATNGVIQALDSVLVAENDKPLTSALEDNDLTSFLQSLRNAGLASMLDDWNNVTVFAPSNEAFDTLPQEVKDHPQRMREILLYHIATSETRVCHFSHGQQISTKLTDRSIQMNLYSNFPLGKEAEVTAQCGRLTKLNRPACSGVIHVTDRVLIPADLDMVDMLRTQSDFSIINGLVEKSGLKETLRGQGPFTMFPPTDAAFYALPRDEFQRILNDTEEATRIVKSHIISENLCCSGILPNIFFLTKRVRTLAGGYVTISRDSRGVMYGESKITTCDLTAKNGVIHSIDMVFKAEARILGGNILMGSCLPQKLETTEVMAFFINRG